MNDQTDPVNSESSAKSAEDSKPDTENGKESVSSKLGWNRCAEWWGKHSALEKVLIVEWYGLAALVGLLLFEGLFTTFWGIGAIRGVVILVLVLGLFRLAHLCLKSVNLAGSASPPPSAPKEDEGKGSPPQANEAVLWPDPLTKKVAMVILVLAAGCLAGLLLSLNPPWTDDMVAKYPFLAPKEYAAQINEALVMMFAAGIGSAISTMLAFFGWACKRKLSPSFAPWYPGRIVMGMLLGLMFYFVVRGGLMFTIKSENAQSVGELNIWGLAAIGALAGMFSKDAIEKFREIFHTVFATSAPDELESSESEPKHTLVALLKDRAGKVAELFGPEALAALETGNEQAFRTEISELDEAQKAGALKKLAELPEKAQELLKPLLEANQESP